MKIFFSLLCFIAMALSPIFCAAEGERAVKIIGRKVATVTTRIIRLEDIASISSSAVNDTESIIGLKRIYIAPSPDPGEELTLSASEVLGRLREENVNFEEVGYLLPRVLSIRRAGRALSKDEVEGAITAYLNSSGKDYTLQGLKFPTQKDLFVAPGELLLTAVPYGTISSPNALFQIDAQVQGEKQVRFKVQAQIEEWENIPVARRPMQKGTKVIESDLMMARVSLKNIPTDVSKDRINIIGQELKQDINTGDLFREGKLQIPPVIVTGSKVIMRIRSRFLEATASGVALDSGVLGGEIRIKNNSSKKVVIGKVLEEGLVEVTP